jgi:nucleoside-diphosphate-sugar epimerase
MKVLVTGHLGYIGTRLVPRLQAMGHDVRGLDSNLYEECTFTGSIAKVPYLRKDIRDVEIGDLDGLDAIIHLAGLSNDPLGEYCPELTVNINYKASVHLAELAKQAGVGRFLFASSCSTYGASDHNFLTEASGFNPVTEYAVSKTKVEQAVCQMADPDFCPVFLRASTAYGLSPRIRFDLVLNNLTAWAFTTGRVHLKSDGTPWRPIVHVDDIAQAYAVLLEAPRETVFNTAFNIGTTTENYQIRDLAAIVQETIPGCTIDFAEDASPDKRCYRVDCNKIARSIPGFKPQWTARRGAQELYEAYQKVGLTLDDFEGPKFKRIAHIKQLINQDRLQHDLRWSV